MNLNLIAYLAYFAITSYIIVVVGRSCYRNGNIFVAALIPGHADLCQKINQVLLLGYYLLNIGYCAITIIGWKTITSVELLVELVAFKSAVIISIISVMHYTNIFIITRYVQKLIK